MESELIQASKQPRPQKPSSTQKQFKDQEIEHFPQGGNPQINSEELTKEQQDLLQEFREKVNSETVKESQIQNNTNISRAKNNSQTEYNQQYQNQNQVPQYGNNQQQSNQQNQNGNQNPQYGNEQQQQSNQQYQNQNQQYGNNQQQQPNQQNQYGNQNPQYGNNQQQQQPNQQNQQYENQYGNQNQNPQYGNNQQQQQQQNQQYGNQNQFPQYGNNQQQQQNQQYGNNQQNQQTYNNQQNLNQPDQNNQNSPKQQKNLRQPPKQQSQQEQQKTPTQEIIDNHPLKNYVAKNIPIPPDYISIFDQKDFKLARHFEDCDDIDVFCREGLTCKSYRCLTKFEKSNTKHLGLKGKDLCEDDDDCSSEKECVMHRCVEDEDEADANKRNEDKDPSVNLLFAGSIFLNNLAYRSGELPDGTFNYDHLFKYILDDIKKADLAVVDQETVFQTEQKFEKKVKNTPSQLGDAIAKAGFKVVLHGTIYAFSKEEAGIKNTLNFWKKYPDVKALGISDGEKGAQDDYYIFKKNGITIGLINFYGHGKSLIPENKQKYVNIMSNQSIEKYVKKLKKETDFVIVCVNWGSKAYPTPSEYQIKWAKDLVNAGVNLIIGYHSALVNPVSYVKSKGNRALVFWNLGHLINDNPKKYSILGAMANVTISKADNETYISDYNLIPTITHKDTGKYYTTFKLSQYTDELFGMSKIEKANFTRIDLVNKCKKVMGGLADCY